MNAVPEDLCQWQGDTLLSLFGKQDLAADEPVAAMLPPNRMIMIEQLLRADPRAYEPDVLSFYQGGQWDQSATGTRKGKPAITVNLIPALVDGVRQFMEMELKRPLSESEDLNLLLNLTLRNMDAQRVYNYAVTAKCEEVMLSRVVPMLVPVRS